MKCSHCGKDISDKWNYCKYCGTAIENEKSNIYGKKFRGKTNTLFPFLISILIFGLIAAGILYHHSSVAQIKDSPTSSPIVEIHDSSKEIPDQTEAVIYKPVQTKDGDESVKDNDVVWMENIREQVFSSYASILSENREKILAGEKRNPRAVSIFDITGDDVPELLFLIFSQETNGAFYSALEIWTFSSADGAVRIYHNPYFSDWMEAQRLFQIEGETTIYSFSTGGDLVITDTLNQYSFNEEKKELAVTHSFEKREGFYNPDTGEMLEYLLFLDASLDGGAASHEEYQEKVNSILDKERCVIISDGFLVGEQPEYVAMTYDEATRYLQNELPSVDMPAKKNEPDFYITNYYGEYRTRYSGAYGPGDMGLSIDSLHGTTYIWLYCWIDDGLPSIEDFTWEYIPEETQYVVTGNRSADSQYMFTLDFVENGIDVEIARIFDPYSSVPEGKFFFSKTAPGEQIRTMFDTTTGSLDMADSSANYAEASTLSPAITHTPFYGIWCSASKDYDIAEKNAERVRDVGLAGEVFVTTDWSNLNSQKYYVVTAGTYSTIDEANAALAVVRQYFGNAYVKYSGDWQG